MPNLSIERAATSGLRPLVAAAHVKMLGIPVFVPLRQHAARLAEVLVLRESPSRWFGVCDWLTVAAAVGDVELNTARYNSSYGWCSSADQYDDAREELLRRFVGDYSVFSFIWGALESGELDRSAEARHQVKERKDQGRSVPPQASL